MTGSTGGRVRRALRSFVLGSGPLKRTPDRVQMAARIVVLLAVLAAPGLALVAAGQARGHLQVTVAAQAAERHEVGAVVLDKTAFGVPSDPGDPPTTVVRATVAWQAPDGSMRQAGVPVAERTTVGSTVPVWVDRTGRLSTPPADPAQIGTLADILAVAAGFAVPLLVWMAYGALCLVLDLHRRRLWARDWARAERAWRTDSAL